MVNERLNIPQTLKVGFQNRKDTFSGKLAYVTYINNKGEIAKQTSWECWRDKKIEIGTYENKPLAGFVLNKSTGNDRYSWNRRVTWCRVYDPRGFEVEISVDNLLYILQESSCTNKELSGEYVYAWDGKDLVLLPTCSVDYKLSTDLINKKEKITAKSLKIGSSYKSTLSEEMVYIGKMDWYSWEVSRVINEYLNKASMHTFVDIKERKFIACNNFKHIDYLINNDVLNEDEINAYINQYKETDVYKAQYIDKLSIKENNELEEAIKNANDNYWKHFQILDGDEIKKVELRINYIYNNDTFRGWMYRNCYWDGQEDFEEKKKFFYDNAKITYTVRHEYSYTFENGILKKDYQQSFISFDSIKGKPSSGGSWGAPLYFKTKDGDLIQKINFDSKSEAVISF